MNNDIDDALSALRVETRDAMFMAGLKARHDFPDATGIPSQWQRFAQYLGSMQEQLDGNAYGITSNVNDGGFDYLCAIESREGMPLPDMFDMLRIPPLAWAMFHYEGNVSGIRGAWQRIWSSALRDARLEAVDAPCVERYGASFDPRTGSGGFELWVPVRGE